MQDYRNLLRQYRVKHFKKGELILCQGNVPPTAFVVKSGVIKVYNLTRHGEEKPIGFDVVDDVFPMAWVFGKVHKARYYYEAFSDCEVYCVPSAEYLAHLESRPTGFMYVMRRLVERVMSFQMRINALERSKAACKVVNVLHYLCLSFGEEIEPSTVEIEIALTQQDLANLTGLTRETTGMELKKLQKQQVLSRRRQHYIVRTDKLSELIDEDYDQGITDDRPKLIA